MIILSPKDARCVNNLVRNHCCNYDNGNCILLDDGDPCVCPQIISYSLLCRWFRRAVLPIDDELYIRLMKPQNTKVCAICGKNFIYRSNREKYCDMCKRTALLRRKAKYRRKRRS